MPRGITPIIAVILLLLITISLVGFAFVFLTRTTETAAGAGEQQLEQQLQVIGSCIRIDNVFEDEITFRNCGSPALTQIRVYVDDTAVKIKSDGNWSDVFTQSVPSNGIATIEFGFAPAVKGEHSIRITSLGAQDSVKSGYPVVAVYDMAGDGFPGGWGSWDSDQVFTWVQESGFAVAKISSDDIANGKLTPDNYDVYVTALGENYPARGKSYGSGGPDLWNLTRDDFIKEGGKVLLIDAYPFYYPYIWGGSSWTSVAGQAGYSSYQSTMNQIGLFFWEPNSNGVSIQKTSSGNLYFPNSANTANERDARPLRADTNICSDYQILRFYDTNVGSEAISMVKFGCFNGAKILKANGDPGPADHVSQLGGQNFVKDAINALLNV